MQNHSSAPWAVRVRTGAKEVLISAPVWFSFFCIVEMTRMDVCISHTKCNRDINAPHYFWYSLATLPNMGFQPTCSWLVNLVLGESKAPKFSLQRAKRVNVHLTFGEHVSLALLKYEAELGRDYSTLFVWINHNIKRWSVIFIATSILTFQRWN